MTHLGIIEVGELCTRQVAAGRELFETLGGWVAATDDPRQQRLFATACHRHAWHAQLWSERRPSVPGLDCVASAPPASSSLVEAAPVDRLEAYRSVLGTMIGELDQIAERVDAELDPSTARTLTLVRNDLVELHGMLG